MSCASFGNERWGHFGTPNCKKKKEIEKKIKENKIGFMQGPCDTKLLQFHCDFFSVSLFAIYSNGSHRGRFILFNFEITQRSHFGSKYTQCILRYCYFHVLLMAEDGHLGMQNYKKSKWFHTRNILAQNWIIFNQGFCGT